MRRFSRGVKREYGGEDEEGSEVGAFSSMDIVLLFGGTGRRFWAFGDGGGISIDRWIDHFHVTKNLLPTFIVE